MDNRYTMIKLIGQGSFGWVHKAIDNLTGQVVAIKIMKPGCHPNSYMSEVHALQVLQHPHIVGLKGVEHQRDSTFLVFEFMDGSLFDVMHRRRTIGSPFAEAEIKSFTLQLLLGLDFMHRSRRFMHRDLKPENLLVDKRGVLKISDLGTATKIESSESLLHNHYVGTRAYRAPEMLRQLRAFEYDEKVDMWAVGVMVAEMCMMGRLFGRGRSSAEVLDEICKVKGIGFRKVLPFASEDAVDLIEGLCAWEPEERPSAMEALQHPFLRRPSVLAAVGPPVVLLRRPFPVVNGDLGGVVAPPLQGGLPISLHARRMINRHGGQQDMLTNMQLARVN